MPSFQSMWEVHPENGMLYCEWNGLEVYAGLRIEPAPNMLKIRFKSPHPKGQVALRIDSFHCKIKMHDGKLVNRTRLIHGDVNPHWKPGDDNSAIIEIVKLSDESKLLISNEYLIEPRGNSTVYEFESWTGNAGILINFDGDRISFQCNSWKPDDRSKFEDIVGSIELVYDAKNG